MHMPLLPIFLALASAAAPAPHSCAHAQAAAPHFLPHSAHSAWCALAAPSSPCAALASAVCGILHLQRGNLSTGSAHLTRATALSPSDWVSHSYLGAAAEYAARQLTSSGGNATAALATASGHFSAALALRGAPPHPPPPPLPPALAALAQPAPMLYRSAGTVLAWQGRHAAASAVFAAGVAEGFGWTTPLQRPTRPLPLLPPAPTPFLPPSDARLAPLLGALRAALPALRAEYAALPPGALALERAGLEARAGWGVLTVAADGALRSAACARLPALCALCAAQPLINATASGQVKFSVLSRGAHILPHAGPTVARLRVHCALAVQWPPGVGALRVGREGREWREGECWAFDESYEHEVRVGEGVGAEERAQTRVVLIFDIVNLWLERLEDVREHGASREGWERHGEELTRLWRAGAGAAGADL
jgi:hypothetical protein